MSLADFAYLMALREPDAMISVVSMVRRGSVVVSFACGALLFRERNLRAKANDVLSRFPSPFRGFAHRYKLFLKRTRPTMYRPFSTVPARRATGNFFSFSARSNPQ